MTDPEMTIGVAGVGLYLPEGRETAPEIAEKSGLSVAELAELGLSRKALPSPDDQPIPMSVWAADQAFHLAGLDPAEVDLVIWTGEEYKDYIAQTAAIRLQKEAGCVNAWAFDLVGQGVTAVIGLKVARDMMIGDPEIETVLLAGGSRNIDLVDYKNPDTRFLLPLSASGGAMILKRGHRANRLLNVVVEVDPEMADEVYVPGGGTEIPFTADNIDSPLMFYQTAHPELTAAYLAERFPRRLVEVIQRALDGRRADYLALRHLPTAQRAMVLAELGLHLEQSIPLNMWGCHGANDPILSLVLALGAEVIDDGQLVALASAGIGFTYAAATIQWGPA